MKGEEPQRPCRTFAASKGQKTQVLTAKDLGLKPRRPASYGHKIQVLLTEDPRLQ